MLLWEEVCPQNLPAAATPEAVPNPAIAAVINTRQSNQSGGINFMKIAVITDDGSTISQHFGYAPYYMVFTVEDNKITAREKREKAGHHNLGGGHGLHPQGERHGFDAGAQSRHASMMDNISDCQVLIAGGMGWGAFEALKSRNIDVIITDVQDIEEAVKLYLDDKLVNLREERLH